MCSVQNEKLFYLQKNDNLVGSNKKYNEYYTFVEHLKSNTTIIYPNSFMDLEFYLLMVLIVFLLRQLILLLSINYSTVFYFLKYLYVQYILYIINIKSFELF